MSVLCFIDEEEDRFEHQGTNGEGDYVVRTEVLLAGIEGLDGAGGLWEDIKLIYFLFFNLTNFLRWGGN